MKKYKNNMLNSCLANNKECYILKIGRAEIVSPKLQGLKLQARQAEKKLEEVNKLLKLERSFQK